MNRAVLLVVITFVTVGVAENVPQATPTSHLNPQVVPGSQQAPQVVKGAPYTAKQTIESTGTLRDGTHIDRITTVTQSRDSEGRTRSESDTSILIQDPEAYVIYRLYKKSHVAAVPIRSAATPEQLIAAAQAAVEAQLPWKITRESLGTKRIAGLLVEGTRITKLRPLGNSTIEPLIKVVEEHWYSPELKVDILATYDDPRQTTKSVYRLTEIQRTEPDPTLFKVPADYTVRDPNK